MELLSQLEHKIVSWFKAAPHLPEAGQKWLADNVWWIVVIGIVLSGMAILGLLFTVFGTLSVLGGYGVSFYASTTFLVIVVIRSLVSLLFTGLNVALLAFAITPLKEKQKKGWVLLFIVWLLNAVSIVVSGVLTLSVFGFITTIIFGALGLAVAGYFLFEIHGQFAHVERSKGVKATKKTPPIDVDEA